MTEPMTDLEIVRACAVAMGYTESRDGVWPNGWYHNGYKLDREWNPLHDDAQAMQLVKRFDFVIERDPRRSEFFGVSIFKPAGWPGGSTLLHTVRNAPDLNRAICECVANLARQDGRRV